VLPDLLGLNGDFAPRFLKRYAELGTAAGTAVRQFVAETRDGSFPDSQHSY